MKGRARPHLSDGSVDPAHEDFLQRHATGFYISIASILSVITLICLYSLWRGPTRSYFPQWCHRLRDRHRHRHGRDLVDPQGLEGSQTKRRSGMWRDENQHGRGKTVYLTDLRRSTTNTLKKPRPGYGSNSQSTSSSSLKINGDEESGVIGMGRDRDKSRDKEVRDGQPSWPGTISTFGNPTESMIVPLPLPNGSDTSRGTIQVLREGTQTSPQLARTPGQLPSSDNERLPFANASTNTPRGVGNRISSPLIDGRPAQSSPLRTTFVLPDTSTQETSLPSIDPPPSVPQPMSLPTSVPPPASGQDRVSFPLKGGVNSLNGGGANDLVYAGTSSPSTMPTTDQGEQRKATVLSSTLPENTFAHAL
ncbi:hypothetical protein IAR55_003072 [Kwoniella newhampshirensis]|uniref:Uncharacterized protein n=1 Tax=Kwoniella newhampshirensis TaxID=1651941 RepID=A0AAW0Z0G3_9TREE